MQANIKNSNTERTILAEIQNTNRLIKQQNNIPRPVSEALQRMENEGGISVAPKKLSEVSVYEKVRQRIQNFFSA